MPTPLFHLSIFLGLTVAYLLLRRGLRLMVREFAHSRRLPELRTAFVLRSLQLGLFVLYLILGVLALGIGYSQFAFFLSSVLAVLGIALFAQWSILSNLTASLFIFFGFPYRVGDQVKVVDKDDDISGEIISIGAFHVQIRRKCGDTVNYPNTLILQKAVIRSPMPIRDCTPPPRRFARGGPARR